MTKSRTILAMSIASALAFGGLTQAQDAREDAVELDVIVVIGIRGSL